MKVSRLDDFTVSPYLNRRAPDVGSVFGSALFEASGGVRSHAVHHISHQDQSQIILSLPLLHEGGPTGLIFNKQPNYGTPLPHSFPTRRHPSPWRQIDALLAELVMLLFCPRGSLNKQIGRLQVGRHLCNDIITFNLFLLLSLLTAARLHNSRHARIPRS